MDDSFTLGVSFDGDGDRVVIVNKNKEIITGDELLGLFTKEYNYRKIVTTKMMNLGMEEYLKSLGKEIIYSSVGDNNVLNKMKELDICLGGESSSHIIFLNSLFRNDGVFTLIKYLNLKNRNILYNKYFYKTINVKTKLDNEKIQKLESRINNVLVNNGRVFIRESGTENLLRINIQLKKEEDYQNVINILKEEINLDD